VARSDLADDLLGRVDELEQLGAVLDALPHGGGARFVVGSPGIGKTILLEWTAAEAARRGFVVLRAIGSASEARLPFAGLYQVLRPVLPLASGLPRFERNALAAAFGESEAGAVPGSDGPGSDPNLVAMATLNLLSAAVAERGPILVAVDDVQWLDRWTLQTLAFVARYAGDDRFAVVAAGRVGFGAEGAVAAEAAAWAAAGITVLRLGALGVPESSELLRRQGLTPGIRHDRILRTAAGNPLALAELAVAWRTAPEPLHPHQAPAPLTDRLREAFADLLVGLPPSARDVLLVVAAHSGYSAAAILEAVRELGSRADEGLDAAVRHGLLVRAGSQDDGLDSGSGDGSDSGSGDGSDSGSGDGSEGLRAAPASSPDGARVLLTHPLLRPVILQCEPLTRVHAAQAAIATTLEARSPEQAAWHRAHSVVGPDEELAARLAVDGGRAVRRQDFAAAACLLRRAADLSADPARRVERLLVAAAHCREIGRQDLVRLLVAEIRGLPLGPIDHARAEALSLDVHAVPDIAPARAALLCDLAVTAAAAGRTRLAWHLLGTVALHCWHAGAPSTTRAAVVEAAELVRTSEPGEHGSPGGRLLVLALADPAAHAGAVQAGLAALEGVRFAGDGTTGCDPRSLTAFGIAAAAVGDTGRAVSLLEAAQAGLLAQHRYGGLDIITGLAAWALLAEGESGRAEAVLGTARQAAAHHGHAWPARLQAADAHLAALRGDPAAALEAADSVAESAGAGLADDRFLRSHLVLVRGMALMGLGRHAEAYRVLNRLFDPEDPVHHAGQRHVALGYLAEAAVHADHGAEAGRTADALAAEYDGAPPSALRIRMGVVRALLNLDDSEEPHLAALTESGLSRFDRARVQLAHGRWLRRTRQVTGSRAPLAAALAVFEAVDARPWADRARAELQATVERRPPSAAGEAGGLAMLSPQERQIVMLAARGLSNREIGQRLHLAPRTVGSHLYRIFPKLGVSSRTQLASVLAQTDPGI
jgi:DNA-binding CsgD family transcriptional regulator